MSYVTRCCQFHHFLFFLLKGSNKKPTLYFFHKRCISVMIIRFQLSIQDNKGCEMSRDEIGKCKLYFKENLCICLWAKSISASSFSVTGRYFTPYSNESNSTMINTYHLYVCKFSAHFFNLIKVSKKAKRR